VATLTLRLLMSHIYIYDISRLRVKSVPSSTETGVSVMTAMIGQSRYVRTTYWIQRITNEFTDGIFFFLSFNLLIG